MRETRRFVQILRLVSNDATLYPNSCLSSRKNNIIHQNKNIGQNKFRFLSSTFDDSSSTMKPNTSSWRRDELEGIAQKFDDPESEMQGENQIRSDQELQQMWKEMESRVTKRRTPMTLGEASMKGKVVGRKNIRPTDEEAWLNAGLYDNQDRNDEKASSK